jgi:hypothetical protein
MGNTVTQPSSRNGSPLPTSTSPKNYEARRRRPDSRSNEALVGIEGPAWAASDLAAWLEDPRRRAKLLATIRRVEAEPSLIGASAHLLVVARRP